MYSFIGGISITMTSPPSFIHANSIQIQPINIYALVLNSTFTISSVLSIVARDRVEYLYRIF